MKITKTEEKGFHFDPSTHRYYYDGRQMTGCTTVLGVVAKPMLIQWAANCAVDYIKDQARQDGKGTYSLEDDILEEARIAHTRKRDKAADAGTDFHALVEEWARRCMDQYQGKPDASYPDEIVKLVEWARKDKIKFLASEKQFYSKTLFVAGTADLLFEKNGKRYVGDIKTMKKMWDRIPFFQCAAYGMLAEEMGEEPFDGYCILRFGREDNSFDEIWNHDIAGDKKGFLAALELYRQMQDFNLKEKVG